MPRWCCTSTGTPSTTAPGSSLPARRPERSARASATTGASTWATSSLIGSACPNAWRRRGGPEGVTWACVMVWDATSYPSTFPHCLRRLDEPLQYPADLDGEVHDD